MLPGLLRSSPRSLQCPNTLVNQFSAAFPRMSAQAPPCPSEPFPSALLQTIQAAPCILSPQKFLQCFSHRIAELTRRCLQTSPAKDGAPRSPILTQLRHQGGFDKLCNALSHPCCSFHHLPHSKCQTSSEKDAQKYLIALQNLMLFITLFSKVGFFVFFLFQQTGSSPLPVSLNNQQQ